MGVDDDVSPPEVVSEPEVVAVFSEVDGEDVPSVVDCEVVEEVVLEVLLDEGLVVVLVVP